MEGVVRLDRCCGAFKVSFNGFQRFDSGFSGLVYGDCRALASGLLIMGLGYVG